jgi:fibronectin-binding autotransporter adhesin
LVNLLPAGKELLLSGRIDIWEDDEPIVPRRFEIDGTGRTRITGSIHDFPDDADDFEADIGPNERQLIKRGSGALVIDVAAGANSHTGPDVIYQGNLHYANDGSLNTGGIRSVGGAVGVDTGVAGNAALNTALDPTSTGGLMLAPSDAAATLDFTGALSSAANMTVAAPEGTTPAAPYNFTGTITPANNKYQLGGGVGTIRLGGAQLTGASNALDVRNGGVVQLHGLNTYGGATRVLSRYVSTAQDQAAGDTAGSANPLQFAQVAPTLEVNKLADGGQASSIGNSSSDAGNLYLHGATLRYTGAGDSTNRLFTVGPGGGTIESSGTGALNFTNTGALAMHDTTDKMGSLDDLGTDEFA